MIASVSFIVLLFHLLFCRACSSSPTCGLGDHQASPLNIADDDSWIRLIVRFKGPHLMAQVHREKLQAMLPNQGLAWRWIERNNAASSHPTDFAVISIPSRLAPDASQVLDESRAMFSATPSLVSYIRDVQIDRRFVGKLNWIPDESNDDDQLAALRDAVISDSDLGSFFSQASDDKLDITVKKRPGRITTQWSFEPDLNSTSLDEEEEEEKEEEEEASSSSSSRRHLSSSMGRRFTPEEEDPSPRSSRHDHHRRQRRRRLQGARLPLTTAMGADKIWAKGFTGKGVKVGAFDTGISARHPHIRNIKERTNWTHQASFDDGLGHGSFVAGIIGSQDKECLGLAPDVELYTFKVFTDDQVSYTSWFLDAFNYAMVVGVHVINLSIGGPDYLDKPFVDKVLEVTSSGILLVSAIGNDGPLWGTLNNPADNLDVIGVGGMTFENSMAGFSSRGMTTHDLPIGTGLIKPDLVAHGDQVLGSRMGSGCKTLSGTSVASPVVAGAVCLLASTIPQDLRWSLLNPGTMKQILVEGAVKLQGAAGMYEQGSGRVDLTRSHELIVGRIKQAREGKGSGSGEGGRGLKASLIPSEIDLSSGACPYAWPYCRQPVYHDAMPLVFNATVVNGMGVTGSLKGPPSFKPTDEGGRHLHLSFEWSEDLWPWSGYLAIFIRVLPSGSGYTGVASGEISFTVTSPPLPSTSPLGGGGAAWLESAVVARVRVSVIPTPARSKRVLWDNFHSIRYPPGYIPRDNIDIKYDVLDWHGDKLATNFHQTFNQLRDAGYFIEELNSPLTCFEAQSYGTLLIVDPEDEFYPEEIAKVESDVRSMGLNLLVFGEWFNLETMKQVRFFDDNTRSWWSPVTGGSNVPALNDLLRPYGIALGDAVLSGSLRLAGLPLKLSSAADVARMPVGSYLHRSTGVQSSVGYGFDLGGMKSSEAPGFGILGVAGPFSPPSSPSGYVSVFGDSSCLDSSHQSHNCIDLLKLVLEETSGASPASQGEGKILSKETRISQAFQRKGFGSGPQRRPGFDFKPFSLVLSLPLQCYSNSPCESQPELKPFSRQGAGSNSNIGAMESLTGFPSSSCMGWAKAKASNGSFLEVTSNKGPLANLSTYLSPNVAVIDMNPRGNKGKGKTSPLIPESQQGGSDEGSFVDGMFQGFMMVYSWIPSMLFGEGSDQRANLFLGAAIILVIGLVIVGLVVRLRGRSSYSSAAASSGSADSQRLQAMKRAMSGSGSGAVSIGGFGRVRRGEAALDV